jgi:hypothetical protein
MLVGGAQAGSDPWAGAQGRRCELGIRVELL